MKNYYNNFRTTAIILKTWGYFWNIEEVQVRANKLLFFPPEF